MEDNTSSVSKRKEATFFTIYLITNRIDGKVYVGQTIQNLGKRFKSHCEPQSGCKHLRNAIQKYGKENFTIEVLAFAEQKAAANWAEDTFIEMMKSRDPDIGYNIRPGGASGAYRGATKEETRQKLSEVGKGRPPTKGFSGQQHPEKWIEEMSLRRKGEGNPFFGMSHTDETKEHWSITRSGTNHPNYGKPMPEEQRLKVSASKTGQKRIYREDGTYYYGTPEEAAAAPNQKEYRSRWQPPPVSEETGRKISDANKGRATENKGRTRQYREDGTWFYPKS